MPANFTTIKNMVMEHIKAAETYGVYLENPNFQEDYIDDEIRKANDDIVAAICSNPLHTRRVDYVTQQAVTALSNGSKFPSSIGGVSDVRIKRSDDVVVVGKLASYEWVDRLRRTTNSDLTVDEKEGYFAPVGTEIYFTGATAGVSFCSPAVASGTTLTAPAEMESVIKDLALSRFYMKHEDKPNSAGFYRALATDILNAVKGEAEIPQMQ